MTMTELFETAEKPPKLKSARKRCSGNLGTFRKQHKRDEAQDEVRWDAVEAADYDYDGADYGQFLAKGRAERPAPPLASSSAYGAGPLPYYASPGATREEAGALKMQVLMQERLLAAHTGFGISQRNQFESQLIRERENSMSLSDVQERSFDSINQYAIRRDAKDAYTCFEQPTNVQVRMFSELLEKGLSQPHRSRFQGEPFPEQRIPMELTAAPIPLVIGNGPSASPVMAINNGTVRTHVT